MKKINKLPKQPKIGQLIYVGTSLYLSHGEDDFIGGKAIISGIDYSKHLPSDHYNYCMVEVEENPGTEYNWLYLLENQKKWAKEFQNQKAHSDPDNRPEFNRWD